MTEEQYLAFVNSDAFRIRWDEIHRFYAPGGSLDQDKKKWPHAYAGLPSAYTKAWLALSFEEARAFARHIARRNYNPEQTMAKFQAHITELVNPK